MNPYQFPVTCDICGGDAVGTISTAAAAWMSNSRIVHDDPDVCRYNLMQYKLKLKKKQESNLILNYEI